MDEKPTFRPFLFPTIFLIIIGWGGLSMLLNFSLPSIWPRWLFFALVVLAGTGTAIPISYWINTFFLTEPPFEDRVIIRQSVGVGVYLAVLAWLGIGRILNLSTAVWLALALIFVEYLMRVREISARSNNVPPQPPVR